MERARQWRLSYLALAMRLEKLAKRPIPIQRKIHEIMKGFQTQRASGLPRETVLNQYPFPFAGIWRVTVCLQDQAAPFGQSDAAPPTVCV